MKACFIRFVWSRLSTSFPVKRLPHWSEQRRWVSEMLLVYQHNVWCTDLWQYRRAFQEGNYTVQLRKSKPSVSSNSVLSYSIWQQYIIDSLVNLSECTLLSAKISLSDSVLDVHSRYAAESLQSTHGSFASATLQDWESLLIILARAYRDLVVSLTPIDITSVCHSAHCGLEVS